MVILEEIFIQSTLVRLAIK